MWRIETLATRIALFGKAREQSCDRRIKPDLLHPSLPIARRGVDVQLQPIAQQQIQFVVIGAVEIERIDVRAVDELRRVGFMRNEPGDRIAVSSAWHQRVGSDTL